MGVPNYSAAKEEYRDLAETTILACVQLSHEPGKNRLNFLRAACFMMTYIYAEARKHGMCDCEMHPRMAEYKPTIPAGILYSPLDDELFVRASNFLNRLESLMTSNL